MKHLVETSVNYKDKSAPIALGNALRPFINENTIVVCIGTDKCIGDSLGPIVGSLLKKERFPLIVYGTLDNPIHAVNLQDKIKMIKRLHPTKFTIAIDACLGSKANIGNVQLKLGPIHPGKGVGKTLASVGNISVVGVVDVLSKNNNITLHNIRLGFIMNIAETIVEGFRNAIYEI